MPRLAKAEQGQSWLCLRGGYFAPTGRPFGQVLALAAQVDAGVAQQPDFQALLSVLRQADKRR